MKYIFSLFFILLITNAGGQTSILQNVTEASQIIHRYKFGGVVGSGAAFFDYNNDYLEDIFLTGGTLPSSLFRNNGDGTFTNVTTEAGLYLPNNFITNGVVTGDLDNDGFRDIFITTLKQGGPNYSHNLLFKNNGDGTFSFITFLAGIHETAQEGTEIQSGFSAAMGDVNLDGYLDIYVANWVKNAVQIRDSITNEVIGFDYTGATNRLYLNNGDMTFTDVADVYGVTDNGCSLVGVFSDYDQDRDMDILVANDFGSWVRPDALYRNDFPSLPFVDVSTESQFATPLYGMAIAVGDYDQDSDLDYYKTSIGPAVLMQNQQDGTFLEVAENAGVADAYVEGDSNYLSTHFGAGFTDFDNDGWLDLAVAKGRVGFDELFPSIDEMPNQLWHNLGDGSFESANHWFDEPCYQMSRGLAYADFDNDGKMDVLFANSDSTYQGNTSGHPFLYQNNFQNDNRWLKVKVEGTVNNRDGFGTHLTIFVNGQSWLHEISGGGQGHSSQNSSVAHFGLGTTEIVDSLIVSWPGNLTAPQTFHQIPINHYLKITEGQTEWEVIQGETPTVSTQEMLIETLNLRIFPNPTHDMVKLPDLDAGTMITLFNSQGQIVKQQLLSTEKSLSLTHLPKGIYWLQAEQLGQFITGKISKL